MHSIYITLLSSLILTITAKAGEICTACSDPTHVMNDESARIIWPPGNPDNTGLSCSDVAVKASEGFFSNCTVLHSYSDFICGCGEEEPPYTCPLCGSGNDIFEPNRYVAGKTCAQWQDYLTNDTTTVDCTHYQTLVGAYCGCDISEPNYFDGYCRICGDSLLPDMNEKVTYQSGKQSYCMEVELILNTHADQYSCSSYQDTHFKACGCDSSAKEIPTLRPSTSDESSATSIASLSLGISMLVFGVLTRL